ncbi:hypothetical protein EKL30_13315 [Candidimonas sp. SYP-B2681]|uniref:hypothetical protein n=1 Tax=Candidimonas sp. SYP-B2681 TaxID=2497686 RepID=UPI000F86474F|nr:hypothetical protein [Candidimonas sp. SYP-B2681]RTZ41547.1 hypothetical protein EKL30_13315 [Candidimonas sp. SYP-B2681]
MTMQNEFADGRTLLETDAWRKRGSIDEIRVKAILLSLCEALRPLHSEGKVFGHMSPQHIVVDHKGRLSLDPSVPGPLGSDDRLFGVLPGGYVAFEQYKGEANWPVGPWTDVYGLSALAYALAVGEAPPNAVSRMVEGSEITFDEDVDRRFATSFQAAIARGLSLDVRARQQSLDEFALGIRAADVSGIPVIDAGATTTGAPAASDENPAVLPMACSNEHNTLTHRPDNTRSFRWRVPVALAIVAVFCIVAWQTVGGHDADSVSSPKSAQVAASTASNRASDSRSESKLATIAGATNGPRTGAKESPPVSSTANKTSDPLVNSKPDLTFDALGDIVSDSVDGAVSYSAQSGPVAVATTPPAQASAANASAKLTEPRLSVNGGMQAGTRTDATATDRTKAVPRSEKSTKRQAEPKPNAVKVGVNVRPWGEVFVNGATRGVSPPLRSLTLMPGTYEIRIVNGDLPAKRLQLTVKEGEPAMIAHRFSADGQ